jgi:hypothetical protein
VRSTPLITILRNYAWAAALLALASAQNAAAQTNYSKPYSKSLQQKDGTRLTVRVDPSNRLVEEILYGADKSILWRLVRELDEAYQPMSATKFDSNDQVLSRHKYLCLKGRIEEEELFNSRGTLLTRTQYFYDKKGRLDRMEHYNPQGRLLNITYNTSAQGAEPVMRDEGTTVIKVPARK